MLQLFSNLKTFIHSKRRSTEGIVFFIHYRTTFLILVSSCLLITSHQFSGSKINCLSKPSGEINVEVLNSYCWASSTYSVRSAYLKEVESQAPHPGIVSSEGTSEYEYRNFYQYIHIVIFIQAILFYLPHIIWKNEEKTLFSTFKMIQSFNEASTSADKPSERKEKVELMMEALIIHIDDRWGRYKFLALKYLFCEVLSMINVLVQSLLLDIFFRGKFIGMGLVLKTYYNAQFPDDPIRLFPIVTVCNFHRYGPSGQVDVIDALCVLPFNAVNAKLYLFQWMWFITLLILSFFSIIHLIACISIPAYRRIASKPLICQDHAGENAYRQLITLGDFGDWFLLSAVKKNMDGFHFHRLAENLVSKIRCLEAESTEP